ncbi:hypothetical protein MHU86_11546 [Fragilaria crotonensis]|nr:hypothetical protein MHU86_11546 [Fragilaria crotonensis]
MSEDRERTGSRHQTDEHETQTDEHHDTTQHKIRIAHNPNELESTKTLLRSTRQQLEDGAFVFPACDFLKERLGRGVDQKGDSQPVAAAGSARAGRRGQPADAVTNPQQDLFPRDANDTWQVFLDHVRSGPIPNMCCRWHLNGNAGAHAPPSSDATPPSKKTKLGPSASAYFQPAFVAQPSQWAFDQERSTAEFHNRRHVGRPDFIGICRPRQSAGTHAHEPSRPATSPTPRISPARDDPSRNEVGPERYAPALDSPPTDHPWRAHCRPETPTTRRHQPSDTPRPLPGKFPSLVPLPTILLPNVDSPFPRPRTTPGRCPCHYFALRPTAHPRDGVSLRLDARRRPPQPRGAQTVRPRPRRRPSGPAVQRPDAGIRVSHRTSRPAPVRPPSGRVFRSASPKAEFRFARSRILTASRTCAPTARGNHKSARGHEAKLISMLKDEASRVGSYHCREKPP